MKFAMRPILWSIILASFTLLSPSTAVDTNSLSTVLSETLQTDFFAYYRLNLYKECPYWTDATSICGNRACAVETIENEDNVPPIWRAEELSKVRGARAEHPEPRVQKQRPKARPLQFQLGEDVDESCVFEADDECDERDYCVPEDEGATAKGDYVSLLNNTERFTGYSGPGPSQVWDAIYRENCFSGSPAAAGRLEGQEAAESLRSVMEEHRRHSALNDAGNDDDRYPLNDACLEHRAFYRIISGMHASISAHICWDYLNQTTGEWGPNLQCYKERLHKHPERISNLYFNYVLVTRAVAKLRGYFETYTFCSGDVDQNFETKQKVLELADRAAELPHIFNEGVMFQDPATPGLKEDFKNRFRNVSRLMDCVGCDKCRLWGKVQTAGYGAALKVLFEFDEKDSSEGLNLRRTELVALVNTLGRIQHSLGAVQLFRKQIEEEKRLSSAQEDATDRAQRSSLFTSATATEAKADLEPDPKEEDDDADREQDPDLSSGWDDLDDDPYAPPPSPEISISDEFWDEWNRVWKAYRYVISSWVSFPFKLFAMVVQELDRLWHFWLGLPVPARTWELSLNLPARDEL